MLNVPYLVMSAVERAGLVQGDVDDVGELIKERRMQRDPERPYGLQP
jgi:hypothetical protein